MIRLLRECLPKARYRFQLQIEFHESCPSNLGKGNQHKNFLQVTALRAEPHVSGRSCWLEITHLFCSYQFLLPSKKENNNFTEKLGSILWHF